MALPKLGEKKNCFDNCGNGIAENVKKKKKIVLAIVAKPNVSLAPPQIFNFFFKFKYIL